MRQRRGRNDARAADCRTHRPPVPRRATPAPRAARAGERTAPRAGLLPAGAVSPLRRRPHSTWRPAPAQTARPWRRIEPAPRGCARAPGAAIGPPGEPPRARADQAAQMRAPLCLLLLVAHAVDMLPLNRRKKQGTRRGSGLGGRARTAGQTGVWPLEPQLLQIAIRPTLQTGRLRPRDTCLASWPKEALQGRKGLVGLSH